MSSRPLAIATPDEAGPVSPRDTQLLLGGRRWASLDSTFFFCPAELRSFDFLAPCLRDQLTQAGQPNGDLVWIEAETSTEWPRRGTLTLVNLSQRAPEPLRVYLALWRRELQFVLVGVLDKRLVWQRLCRSDTVRQVDASILFLGRVEGDCDSRCMVRIARPGSLSTAANSPEPARPRRRRSSLPPRVASD